MAPTELIVTVPAFGDRRLGRVRPRAYSFTSTSDGCHLALLVGRWYRYQQLLLIYEFNSVIFITMFKIF